MEDLTQVVSSYKIYEMSLLRVSYISYEMTMTMNTIKCRFKWSYGKQRFCLPYDHLKRHFIVFIMNIISIRKRVADKDIVNYILRTRQTVIHCGHTLFMTRHELHIRKSNMDKSEISLIFHTVFLRL